MAQLFSDKHISVASAADIPAIKDLLNSAYRGEGSKQGWTTEADLITGDTRTDEHSLNNTMQEPGSVILRYVDDHQQIIACVNLQQHVNKVYLGMFSVSPKLQGGGIGKLLLKAAEEYAQHLKCDAIYMSVITVRKELIDWYKRHGYADTGERKAFADDGSAGKHLQPLEFMILEKAITQ